MLPVIQYWHQTSIPDSIRSRQDSWRRKFPDRYELYDRQSASDFLSLHFGPEALSAFHACAVPAMASDFFRYHRLAVTEGLYVDAAFLPGDPTAIEQQTDQPVFTLSVPQIDLTPEFVRARTVLGRVLLNGVLRTSSEGCPWFTLLAKFVRHLIREKASDRIPMVTGIGALTVFDYAVAAGRNDPRATLDQIRLALPGPHDRFLAVCQEFLDDNSADLFKLSPCIAAPANEMEALFRRPIEDAARFTDPAHWSNHQGSIYSD